MSNEIEDSKHLAHVVYLSSNNETVEVLFRNAKVKLKLGLLEALQLKNILAEYLNGR